MDNERRWYDGGGSGMRMGGRVQRRDEGCLWVRLDESG